MSSGPEGEQLPSRPGRIYDGICADSCLIQEPLDVAGGSIYDNAISMRVLMICLAVRMMRHTGHQVNLRARPTVLSNPCGMPSPFFGP